jgi:hypothetical protein
MSLKKDTENQVKAYFVTNIQPEIKNDLSSLQDKMISDFTFKNQLIDSNTNKIESIEQTMNQVFKDFETKIMLVVNNCDERSKQVEVNTYINHNIILYILQIHIFYHKYH